MGLVAITLPFTEIGLARLRPREEHSPTGAAHAPKNTVATTPLPGMEESLENVTSIVGPDATTGRGSFAPPWNSSSWLVGKNPLKTRTGS